MNTLFQRFWRTGVLTLFVGGMMILALGGYLTPVLRVASTPVISAQRWLASRYLAIFQAINSPQDMAALRQRSALLEEENARLQSQMIELQQQLQDSEFKDELLGFARSRPEDTHVGANVIGRDPSPFLQYIFIDKGSDDGLVYGMPVVTAQGLVGRIDGVIANAARVQLITDPASSVNVQLSATRTEAILTGSLTGDVILDMVPQDADLQSSAVILTSALGGNFPANILVGQVVSVRRLETALFQSASVQPSVNFSDLRSVLVVVDFTSVDLSPLVPAQTSP